MHGNHVEEEAGYLVMIRYGNEGLWMGFMSPGSDGSSLDEAKKKMEEHFGRGKDAVLVKVVDQKRRDYDRRS